MEPKRLSGFGVMRATLRSGVNPGLRSIARRRAIALHPGYNPDERRINPCSFDMNVAKMSIGQHDFSGLSVAPLAAVASPAIGMTDSRPYKLNQPLDLRSDS